MAESMPDKKTLAKLKQDAKELKAMSKTGNMDLNKAMPMMQDMARVAARSDMGSKFLGFMQKMASAIKKGIDTNMYSPKDLPMMQKAYDSIISQMPQLQKMASDSKALAQKYGRTDREKASLDDKGNYKGTNITPTKQQAQQLARNEDTNASSIATVSGNVGTMQSRSMYNADGTMKNGADYGNLLGGKKKTTKKKKA